MDQTTIPIGCFISPLHDVCSKNRQSQHLFANCYCGQPHYIITWLKHNKFSASMLEVNHQPHGSVIYFWKPPPLYCRVCNDFGWWLELDGSSQVWGRLLSRWKFKMEPMEFLMCKLSHCRSPIGGLPKLLSPKLMCGCTPLDLPIQVGFSIPWSPIIQEIWYYIIWHLHLVHLVFSVLSERRGMSPLPVLLISQDTPAWVCPTLSLFQEALILNQPLYLTISWDIMGWPIYLVGASPGKAEK